MALNKMLQTKKEKSFICAITPLKKGDNMKHKRTKACEITKQVRQTVTLRDNGRCVICYKTVPGGCSNAHFVKRSQGGLGIEENIVTLCPKCHFEEDFGQDSKLYENKIETYLKGYYGANWDKSKLVYKKY